MAKVLCVLYDDPIEGYPTSYPRDDIPTTDLGFLEGFNGLDCLVVESVVAGWEANR